jgi:hypothetical protein
MSGRNITHLSNKVPFLCETANIRTLHSVTEGVPSSFRDLTALPNEQMLGLTETAHLLDVSIRTLQRMAQRGEGPVPLRWGRKCTRYQLGIIRRWLENENRRAQHTMLGGGRAR